MSAPVELSPFRAWLQGIRFAASGFRRRWIPALVWYGDELDVVVTFKEDKLQVASADISEATLDSAFQQLTAGHLPKIERDLADIGIGFDKGIGPNGRDWEWDYSLRGPISVQFRRKASNPESRA